MRRRWKSKRRSRPIKSSKTYKDGMKKQAVMYGVLGILSVAIFYKTPLMQMVVNNTPTFGENK